MAEPGMDSKITRSTPVRKAAKNCNRKISKLLNAKTRNITPCKRKYELISSDSESD